MNVLHQHRLSKLTVLVLGAWAALATGNLHAQTTPEVKPGQEKAAGQLETVTVTANRRVEDAQKVSVSVTAVSGDTLAERNITDLSQMEGMSAGFTFGRSGADARPAIRGVRTENVAVNADTTIGYFVDGIYKSRAQQALSSFLDLSRVEIQRGPQGTLFGRNTFGGNIVLTTNAPELKTFEAAAGLTIGSFNKVRVEGVLNIPINDMFAGRIAVAYDKAKPYVKNDFNPAAGLFDQDLTYVRAQLLFKPNSSFEATLRGDLTEQRGNGGSAFGYKQGGTYVYGPSCTQLFNTTFQAINPRPGNRDGVNDCTRTVGNAAGTVANAIGTGVDLGIPIYQAGNAYRIDNDAQTFLRLSDKNLSLDASYKLGDLTLKSITGYANFGAARTSDSDMSASTVAVDFQNSTARTISQEFQVLSDNKGPLTYVGGLYFFSDKLLGNLIQQQFPRTIRSSAAAPLSLAAQPGFYDIQAPETKSSAAYAQLSYQLDPAIKLTGGLRYTADTKKFKFANADSLLPLNASNAPNRFLIDLNTPNPAAAAYGAAGTSNCTGSNNLPGYNCGTGTGLTNTLYGGTYADVKFTKTTWRLAGEYKLSNAQLLYASASTGFRSGGFNSGQALETARSFNPETVLAIELGSKNRFLNNTLQVNAAIFSNGYKDLQEQRQIQVTPTATVSAIFNAAKARASGAEIETEWRLTKATTVGGSLSLLNAKYTDYRDVPLPFGTSILVADPTATTATLDANGVTIAPAGQRRIFAPGYNCGVIAGTGLPGQPATAFACDLTGKRLPYSPKVSASVFVKNDFNLSNGQVITPVLALTYSSGYFGQPTNAEIERQASYVKADLKLNYKYNDNFKVQAYIDNVADVQVINRFVWGGGGALQVSAAPPRTFGLKFSYSSF